MTASQGAVSKSAAGGGYGGTRAIAAASIGHVLEWYDFTVYALFAIYIAQSAFFAGDPVSSLTNAFLTFGVGFIIRPIGAVVLGAYADRAGRKAALTLSLAVMATGTLFIAVAPPFAAIGIGAPLLILCGRLLQGFSAGGEIGGAASFLVEHAPPARRAAFSAWLQSSMAMSNILGATVAVTLTLVLTPAQLAEWGWRVPFIIGLAIAPVGIWLRSTIAETPAFEAERRSRDTGRAHTVGLLRDVIGGYPRELGRAIGLSVIWVVAVYTLVIYMPTYAQRSLGFTAAQAFAASVCGNVVMVITCLASGRLSDRVGWLLTLRVGAALLLVATLPVLYWILATGSVVALIVGQGLFCGIVAIFAGSAPVALASLFPTRVRSTGLSLAYNFSATIFGGFAPALLTFLTERAGWKSAPALYVMVAAGISLAVMVGMKEGRAGWRPHED